jgi:hypothetical protein
MLFALILNHKSQILSIVSKLTTYFIWRHRTHICPWRREEVTMLRHSGWEKQPSHVCCGCQATVLLCQWLLWNAALACLLWLPGNSIVVSVVVMKCSPRMSAVVARQQYCCVSGCYETKAMKTSLWKHCVVSLKLTDFSEVFVASIIRATSVSLWCL